MSNVKTKAIVIESYYYIDKLARNPIEGVILSAIMISFEKVEKTLGVLLDNKLNWKEQVSSIC